MEHLNLIDSPALGMIALVVLAAIWIMFGYYEKRWFVKGYMEGRYDENLRMHDTLGKGVDVPSVDYNQAQEVGRDLYDKKCSFDYD